MTSLQSCHLLNSLLPNHYQTTALSNMAYSYHSIAIRCLSAWNLGKFTLHMHDENILKHHELQLLTSCA